MANNLLQTIISAVMSLLEKNIQDSPQQQPAPTQAPIEAPQMNILDWSNPDSMVSKYFSVQNCLFLPTWGRMATEADGLNDEVKNNLINLCTKMDEIKEFLGCGLNIHCIYRPPAYSPLVGGTATDVHTQGLAIDFDCNKYFSTDQVKEKFNKPNGDDSILEKFGIRMEDNGPSAGWIHIDIHAVGYLRFFKA
jgi:Peptidase M15